MKPLVVNISDMKFSSNPEDVISTYSLGSCLGITAYDPEVCVGGMVHCLLPQASLSKRRSSKNPYMFVDSGVTAMVRKLVDLGAKKERLIFKVAGGANMRNDNLFNTGERNYAALARLMDRSGVKLTAEEVGGTIPRTMFLYMATGRVVIRSLGEEREI